MEEQNINYIEEEVYPPRRHKLINAVVLTIMLSLTFAGASSLKSKLCSPDAKTSNIECLGINILLLLHIPFAQIPMKNAIEYLFTKDGKKTETKV